MSDYLQNLVAGALGKSDILQPRLPSLFEPVLSAGLPVGLTDEMLEGRPEEGTEKEPDSQRHKSISRHNPDDKRTELPAYNPIETENGQGHFEFEVQGRRDAVHSNDQPLQPEYQVAAALPRGMNQFAREEPGRVDDTEFSISEGDRQKYKSAIEPAIEPVLSPRTESMEDQNARATSNDELGPAVYDQVSEEGVLPDYSLHPLQEPESSATNSPFQPKIKGEKTLFINKARREKSVLESLHEPVEEAVLPGNGVEMSNYLQNLVTGALGKSDILQPRLPSLFEPVLSAGLPVGLTDGIMEVGPEEETMQEAEGQRHKSIPGHNPDDKRTKLPASNPIETENGQGHIEFEVQGRRDTVLSNDLPLQPEEQAAGVSLMGSNQSVREEPGRLDGIEFSIREGDRLNYKSAIEPVLSRRIESMKDQNARATSNDELGPPVSGQVKKKGVLPDLRSQNPLDVEFEAINSSFPPKIPPNNSYSKMESGLTKRRINSAVISRRALFINKARREKSFLESSPGREQAEALPTKMEEPDSRHQATASNRAPRIDHSRDSEIKTKDPAFSQKRVAAGARSSQFPKQSSTEASWEPSEQMPPSIKVTIGRIEVRAVTPPVKREPKKETKNPSTSLGDYLSSLRGGAR